MANEGRLIRLTSSDIASTAALGVNLTNAEIAAKLEAGEANFASKSGVSPRAVCADYSGNLYVCDRLSHAIYKIDEGGQISTYAGEPGTSGDNGTLTNVAALDARFTNPRGIACDKSGNIYVADTGNNQIRVIRDGFVSHVAGDGGGVSGASDGVGGAASFDGPFDLDVDPSGVVWVADTGNNMIRRIIDGTVYTFAGSQVAGDKENVAVTAEEIFDAPQAISVDQNGDLFVCDTGNRKIKKVIQTGHVYLHSGSGSLGRSLGTTAFNCEYDTLVRSDIDASGNLYVVDSDVDGSAGSRLLRISSNGIPSVINDFNGTTVDGSVVGVAVSPAGKFFVISFE